MPEPGFERAFAKDLREKMNELFELLDWDPGMMQALAMFLWTIGGQGHRFKDQAEFARFCREAGEEAFVELLEELPNGEPDQPR